MQLTTLYVLASVVLGLPSSAGSDDVRPVERPGDGSVVCGLGKEFHAGRRAALREKLEKGLVVLRGLGETRGYTRFHQDKVFWYLTGVESPGAAFAMDVETGEEVLFLPARNAWKERWEGECWDAEDEWVGELTAIADVRPAEALEAYLAEHVEDGEPVWVSLHPHVTLMGCADRARPFDHAVRTDPFDGRESRERAFAEVLAERFGAEVEDLSGPLNDLRRVKTPEEVAAMRRAARAGALAMSEAIRSTRPGIGEWDVEALMTWIQVHEGATGPAYHGIVGGGPNSLVLHYSASNRVLGEDEVLLIDYGPELDHYTTDITRTWPVDGTFDERQAELYDAVLAAQKAGIAAVKPGVSLRTIEAACDAVFRERGLYELRRHSACHYIGLEVHDVGSRRDALVPGVAFTVEPGLYEEATGIGIRIEDVVVVTQDGCEVLTADVPKERAEVEALVAQEGVLDWMAGRGR